MEMSTRPEVIRELRSLFKEGATPSHLIRHIVERHAGERRYHQLIQDYFREAFGVPIVRGLNPIDDYRHADLRHAFLNEEVVHEIIQRKSEWDENAAAGTGRTDSWLDPLNASDDHQRISQLKTTAIPELARIWSQLTPEEQHFIDGSMATANGLYETVKILSRLAECLQQRVVELEAASMTPLEEHR
jgi:hypothetical protein